MEAGSNTADGSRQEGVELLTVDALPGDLWALVLAKCSWRGAWLQVQPLLLAHPGAGMHLQGHAQLLSELIGAQADPHPGVSLEKHWPLGRPAMHGRADVLALLLQRREWPQEALANALEVAVRWHQLHILQQLLGTGLVERGSVKTAVELAWGKNAMLKSLLKHGPEHHSCYGHALWRACVNGHVGVVELLKHAGLGRQSDLDRLLAAAAEREECIGVMKLLISYGADVDAIGGRVLGGAALWGYNEVVEVLLDAGADIDGGWKCNPLHCAVSGRHESTVRLLLVRGADVNACDAGALHHAACHGNTALTRLLVEHGARLPADEEDAILQYMEEKGHHEVVQLLRESFIGAGACATQV